ncbi:hypothetical protein RJ639_033779 [Escallonia herrerae]|uniref:Uncharacterized protein n=1 Tax=Escallonia herrerae TaxID=1293975 RepID=A0AA88WSQ7_9ASTE|nr:hypothetical protein RJ639_033779 [Escallonia herrerae]
MVVDGLEARLDGILGDVGDGQWGNEVGVRKVGPVMEGKLLRLEGTPSLPQTIPQSQNKQAGVDVASEDEDDNEDQERQDRFVFEKPRLDFVQFDQMGPFEPLVLSLPGESPVVQSKDVNAKNFQLRT